MECCRSRLHEKAERKKCLTLGLTPTDSGSSNADIESLGTMPISCLRFEVS